MNCTYDYVKKAHDLSEKGFEEKNSANALPKIAAEYFAKSGDAFLICHQYGNAAGMYEFAADSYFEDGSFSDCRRCLWNAAKCHLKRETAASLEKIKSAEKNIERALKISEELSSANTNGILCE